jgi:hypothetical protein
MFFLSGSPLEPIARFRECPTDHEKEEADDDVKNVKHAKNLRAVDFNVPAEV